MTREEAIYCLESYLPNNKIEHCVNCPYYGSVDVDWQIKICRSSEAHRMAIEALKKEGK